MVSTVNFGLLLTFLIPLLSNAYRLRQNSGLVGYEDPYSLSNALGAIELQRRQIADLSDQYGRYPSDLELDNADTELYNIPNSPYYAERYPYSYYNRKRNINAPQKRTAYHPHRVVPSVDELRRLFSNANVPVKRLAPFKQTMVKDTNNVRDSDKRSIKDDMINMEENKEQLTDRLREMIDTAEKMDNGNEKVVTKTETIENENGEPEEVKETEISNTVPLKDGVGEFTEKVVEVFENAMDNDNEQEAEIKNEQNTGVDSSLDTVIGGTEVESEVPNSKIPELEQLISNYLSNSRTKSKRASRSDITTVRALLAQIAELKEELNSLEIDKTLLDKENDYLANALKYATLDQLVGGEEFMTKEYDDIVKATQTEELLQMLLEGQGVGEENTVDDDEDDQPYPGDAGEEMLEKRAGANSEGWYDTPITENVVGGAELHSSAEEKRARLSSSDMGSEFPIAIPYPDDSNEMEDDVQDELGGGDNDIEETEALADQDEQSALLRKILSGMSPQQVQQLVEDYTTQEELEQDTGVCPAVMELSSDCSFTERAGILIDDDARNLCNRHEMCYKCGENIGLTQERCDLGYKNTVIENCEGDERCLRSAILFLELMHQYHSYSLYGSPQCQQPCVERFIYEGE